MKNKKQPKQRLKIEFRQEDPFCRMVADTLIPKTLMPDFASSEAEKSEEMQVVRPENLISGDGTSSITWSPEQANVSFVRSGRRSYWIRVKVRNPSQQIAKKCIGKITKIEEKKEDQSFAELQRFDPVVLRCVGHKGDDFSPHDILGKDHEFLDVCYTLEEEERLFLATDPRARGSRLDLKPGEYTITVLVSGENVKSVTARLSLVWNGVWDKTEVKKVD